MDEEIKENGEMATIEDEEEITIEEDYTALEAETIIIDDDSNIQTEAEYEQAVGQKELADEAREALSAVLLSVLEKGEINDDDIAEIAAQQEIYTENVTTLKILGLTTEDGKSTAGKSTTNVITSNIDYNELMKVLSEKADWLYIDEDGQVMLNGEVVPKLKVVELEAEKIKADVGEFKNLTTENFTATNATIENLKANKADIEYLNANYATIENLNATNANITNLQATKANIIDLNAANANIANLQAIKANITDLDAAKADINVLNSDVANIQTLVNGNLTSDNIQSMVITGDKFTVANGFIKNAMIDSVSANKINAGVINTNNVSIQSDDGSMLLQGNLQQFKDKNGKVRIQIGKDAKGNFTFCLYDENGTGQLINEKGIQSSNAIADGLIVDAKVAENANIAGSKLDIDSVVTEVNNGSTSIKGTKIYLDNQKQSLDVAFNNMTTTVKGNTDTLNTHTTSINTMGGKVTQLISDTTITKQDGTTTSLKDAYNATVDTVNSHSTKIGSLETNLATANNNISSVSSKQTALEQNLNGFKQTVSDTYTTKAEFNNLDIGGRNLVKNSNFAKGSSYWSLNWATSISDTILHNGHKSLRISASGQENYGWFGCFQTVLTDIKPNTTITISCWYYVEDKSTFDDSFGFELKGEKVEGGGHEVFIGVSTYSSQMENGVWKKIVATRTTDCHWDYLYIYPWVAKNGTVYVTDLKVELGNKATDWTPAPEDIDDSITLVDNKFASYSTTSQMNSAINQKANEITSTVSSTYTTKTDFNNLSIGGTNLLSSRNILKNNNLSGTNGANIGAYVDFHCNKDFIKVEPGIKYYIKINNPDTSLTNCVIEKVVTYNNGTYVSTIALNNRTSAITIPSNANQIKIVFVITGGANYDIVTKYKIKVEKGNRPTDWSPCPDDIDNAIATVDNKFTNYSTTTQMNSAINQKANEITSSVSQTYATTQSTSTLLKENITEYYLSTSNTTLSGGAWGTTSYTPTPGKYIWQRTKSVTNAGDIKYSNPICVSDEMYTVILKNEVLLLKCNSDGEVI